MSLIERNWWTNLEMPYKEKVLSLSLDHTIAFSDLSTIRYESAMAKVPLVVEHIKNTLESEEKLVVFAHHKKVAAEIGAAFKGVVTYTGDHTVEQRQAAVDAFQEDPNVRLFVGTKAAWVGITLTAASIVIFAELDWVPGDVTQGEDRLHRKGQKNAVLVQHLVVDGSIDAKIAQILVAKQEILDAALGGGE
jgi:SWI/SNF-related matrix-associated actin-dependent regulator 1 of chromatin subfamily A